MTIAPAAPMPWVAGPGAALPPAPPLWALWGVACERPDEIVGVCARELQPEPVLGVAWVAVPRDGR